MTRSVFLGVLEGSLDRAGSFYTSGKGYINQSAYQIVPPRHRDQIATTTKTCSVQQRITIKSYTMYTACSVGSTRRSTDKSFPSIPDGTVCAHRPLHAPRHGSCRSDRSWCHWRVANQRPEDRRQDSARTSPDSLCTHTHAKEQGHRKPKQWKSYVFHGGKSNDACSASKGGHVPSTNQAAISPLSSSPGYISASARYNSVKVRRK